MPYERFHLIDFIHFVTNTSLGQNYEKTAKIKPTHDYLVHKFR